MIGVGSCGTSGPPAPGALVGQQLDSPLPRNVTSAPLVASDGHHFTLGSLATGRVVVLSDFMTLCQESCPLDTANIVAAARAVERSGHTDDVAFVSLTIDPSRDTVKRLAAFRKLYGTVPSNWYVATGSAHDLAKIWRDLGVYIQRVPDDQPAPKDWWTGKPLTYDLTHSDDVFFFDRRTRERFLFDGVAHVAKGAPIPETIDSFMDAEGRTNIEYPQAGSWTLPNELATISWLIGHRVTVDDSTR